MGTEYCLELERDIGVSADIFPTYLFRGRGWGDFYDIEKIERKLGLVSSMTWFGSATCWHLPDEALKTIRGLLDYFYQNNRRQEFHSHIEALERIQMVLREAQRQGVRFHFDVVGDL